VFTILEHLHAIDEDVLHANLILVRIFEGGAVGNGLRIEDHHVSKHSCSEKASTI
jgi:hypothetical protein